MDEATQRAANKKTLEQIFSLISSKRADEAGPFLTEDLYFELPYGPGRKPIEAHGRDAFLAMNACMCTIARREKADTESHTRLRPRLRIPVR